LIRDQVLINFVANILHLLNHKNKTTGTVKGNTSYLVGAAITPNLSYLLAVKLAASTAIPFNTHKIKKLRPLRLKKQVKFIL